MLKYLLSKGASPATPYGDEGYTPLYIAAGLTSKKKNQKPFFYNFFPAKFFSQIFKIFEISFFICVAVTQQKRDFWMFANI